MITDFILTENGQKQHQ